MRCWNQPESLPLEVMLLPGFCGGKSWTKLSSGQFSSWAPSLQSTCWVPKETELMANTLGATLVSAAADQHGAGLVVVPM